MNCCVNCFNDSGFRDYITFGRQKGDCDICKNQNVMIMDVGEASCRILDIIGYKCPREVNGGKESIFSIIQKNKLFTDIALRKSGMSFDKLIQLFCGEDIYTNKYSFDERAVRHVSIVEFEDGTLSLVSGDTNNEYQMWWELFKNQIKHKKRFFYSSLELVTFNDLLIKYKSKMLKGTRMWRARMIKPDKEIEELRGGELNNIINKIGPPPPHYARDMRMNPKGISYLYCAENDNTAIKEVTAVKAETGEKVLIGQLQLKQDIDIIDFTLPKFHHEITFWDPDQSKKVFMKDFIEEVSKPMSEKDDPFEYLPTQVIAEFIRDSDDLNVSGIKFISQYKTGYNLAFYKSREFEKYFELISWRID